MKKGKPREQDWSETPRLSPQVNYRVSEFIRTAESNVAAGKYTLALEQLERARKTAPNNKYIDAIIERVQNLKRSHESGSVQPPKPVEVHREDSGRYLSVTVGNEFKSGIKPLSAPRPVPVKSEFREIVHELTDIAQEFLKLNLPEPAFDALMKAYMLDPLSPDVLKCEQKVLPAWNLFREARGSAPIVAAPEAPELHESQRVASQVAPEGTTIAHDAPIHILQDHRTEDDEERMEVLLQQKELERQERERAVWREASSLPKIFVEELKQEYPAGAFLEPGTSKPARRFLGRLKRRKS